MCHTLGRQSAFKINRLSYTSFVWDKRGSWSIFFITTDAKKIVVNENSAASIEVMISQIEYFRKNDVI